MKKQSILNKSILGKEVWIYDGYEFVENSPLPLSSYGLPDTLDKVDAVQIWSKNG